MSSILDAITAPYGLSKQTTLIPLGHGHINRTFLLRDGERCMVVQRLNTQVFKDLPALIGNALKIEQHLMRKRLQGSYAMQVLHHLSCAQGHYLHGPQRDIRVLEYFADGQSIEVLERSQQAEQAAGAFAHFTAALIDLDAASLHTILPDFLHLPRRFEQFEAACAEDLGGRVARCAEPIAFCRGQASLLEAWCAAVAVLPQRVCHNDCKINNLLFDRGTGLPLAVIDIDTCMAGNLMSDFGDLVRSCCSPEAEDSAHLENVMAREGVFAALARGYRHGLRNVITPVEQESLLLGAKTSCFMQGMRFLTDYLNGDTYFGAAYVGHNLQRAENQFTLYRSICAQEERFAGYLC